MTPTRPEASPCTVNRPLTWSGFRQVLPIALFVAIFGAAFGVAAVQVGLQAPLIFLTSATVFAGAAQFAALELWGAQVPILPLVVTVFAINARHLLMGATLYPWLRHLPTRQRYGIMVLASDANWALALQAFTRGQPGFGLLLGGGLALWMCWLIGTVLGTFFGGAIQDPTRFGLDVVMACFLLSMVVGGPKSWRLVVIWGGAGASAWWAHRHLPANTHVVIGALSGGLLGALWLETPDAH